MSNRQLHTDERGKRVIYTADARLSFTAAQPPAEGAATGIGTLEGYALVWDALSSDRGGYKVRLMPGSATFAPLTHALYHHQWTGGPLGDTATGTLRLTPDDIGVRVQVELPDTQLGRDVAELVRTGRVKGMSFAMIDAPTSHETEEDGQIIVNAESYTVDEVTITAIPAFTATSIGVKADDRPQLSAEKENVDARKEHARQTRKLEEHRLSLFRL